MVGREAFWQEGETPKPQNEVLTLDSILTTMRRMGGMTKAVEKAGRRGDGPAAEGHPKRVLNDPNPIQSRPRDGRPVRGNVWHYRTAVTAIASIADLP
jgi:hypothetical protein